MTRTDVVEVRLPPDVAERIAGEYATDDDMAVVAERARTACTARDEELTRRRCGVEYTADGLVMPFDIFAMYAICGLWWAAMLPTVKQVDMRIDHPVMVTW